jgi:hypothetical protein
VNTGVKAFHGSVHETIDHPYFRAKHAAAAGLIQKKICVYNSLGFDGPIYVTH